LFKRPGFQKYKQELRCAEDFIDQTTGNLRNGVSPDLATYRYHKCLTLVLLQIRILRIRANLDPERYLEHKRMINGSETCSPESQGTHVAQTAHDTNESEQTDSHQSLEPLVVEAQANRISPTDCGPKWDKHIEALTSTMRNPKKPTVKNQLTPLGVLVCDILIISCLELTSHRPGLKQLPTGGVWWEKVYPGGGINLNVMQALNADLPLSLCSGTLWEHL
jgi:hypothetical protein